jgi:uncharacterized protein YkwD
MSKASVILGLIFVVLIFVSTYVGAYIVIMDSETDVSPNNELNYSGDINKTQVLNIMHSLVNEERMKRNLDRLRKNSTLQQLADYKASKMADKRYISHTSPSGQSVSDRFERFNLKCSNFGENLAQTHYKKRVDVNYGGYDTYTNEEELAEGVIQQFMASDSHKENILDKRWKSMSLGIGITEGGRVYVSQEFCGSTTPP